MDTKSNYVVADWKNCAITVGARNYGWVQLWSLVCSAQKIKGQNGCCL